MRYADSTVCPDCRTPLAGQTRCPSCSLDLTAPALARVWGGLVAVDTALVEARTQSAAAPAPATAAPASATATAAPPAPMAPAPVTPRHVNTGSVLLALGALFVLVAGAIFVAVAWGDLGVLGRALVLLAFTALIGATSAFVTRRGLRASAEALWGVFLGLLALDWFAAHAQGLANLDRLPWGLHTILWGAVAVAASLAIVAHARRHLSIALVVPSVVAGIAAWAAGLGAISWYEELVGYEHRLAWGAAAALAVAALITLVLRRAGNQLGWQIGIAACVAFGAAATWLAVIDALEHPSLADLAAGAHGLPLLLAAVGSLAVAAMADRLRPGLTALAVAELALLLAIPAHHARPEYGAYLVGAGLLLALVAAATGAGGGGWWRGIRIGAATVAAALFAGALPWLARAADVVLAAEPGDDLDPTTSIRTTAEWSGDAWLVALVGLSLTTATLLASRWSEPTSLPRYAVPAAALVAGGFLPLVAAAADPSVLTMAASVLGAAALAVFAALRSPSEAWEWVPVLVLAAAATTALGSWWVCVIIWPITAALFVVLAALARANVWRAIAAGGAALAGLGTVLPLAEALELAVRPGSLAAVIAGVAGLAVASQLTRAPDRVGVEVGSALVALMGLLGGTDASLAWLALLCTVAGAVVALIGVVDERRGIFRWVGTGLLGLAWVLRLLASDVDVVEAYTAPFAAALLAVGGYEMWRRHGLRSAPALSAGLTLALLPSLPLVVDDPTSLRALLLGLVAAGCLAAGVSLRWRAPFVGGVATLTVIAIVELWPYAMAIERWTLMAAIGVGLLGIGITWEQRVRDGRAVARYVDAMR